MSIPKINLGKFGLTCSAVGASLLLLVACSQSQAPQVAKSIDVKNSIGLEVPLNISEVCYDGVVYLMNDKGGMAPKMDGTSPNNATLCK
jgi:hypothetical protein